jgi:hypothetical protein
VRKLKHGDGIDVAALTMSKKRPTMHVVKSRLVVVAKRVSGPVSLEIRHPGSCKSPLVSAACLPLFQQIFHVRRKRHLVSSSPKRQSQFRQK